MTYYAIIMKNGQWQQTEYFKTLKNAKAFKTQCPLKTSKPQKIITNSSEMIDFIEWSIEWRTYKN